MGGRWGGKVRTLSRVEVNPGGLVGQLPPSPNGSGQSRVRLRVPGSFQQGTQDGLKRMEEMRGEKKVRSVTSNAAGDQGCSEGSIVSLWFFWVFTV